MTNKRTNAVHIQLLNSREENASAEALILDVLEIGALQLEAVKQSRFYRDLRIKRAIADTIRQCNHILGCGGNFKNGCLYREKGLPSAWRKDQGDDARVTCDHAIPVTELVRQHMRENMELKQLIFSPVVRIRQTTNATMTSQGLAKNGFRRGFPLSRYKNERVDVEIVTYRGDDVDPNIWTDRDHWALVAKTEELFEVLKNLGIDAHKLAQS